MIKIAIGSDHGGYALKTHLKAVLCEKGIFVDDKGCVDESSVDYPDYAAAVAHDVSTGVADRGMVICTTGIGVSITANKFPGVRASLCHNVEMAQLTRQHNDSNILCLSQRYTTEQDAVAILDAWLDAEFEGGRHLTRVEKIHHYEISTPE